MALNRISPGSKCTIIETGEKGIIKKIFFYPTKFEIEFSDGSIEHHTSKDIKITGIKQDFAILKKPEIPDDGIGEMWSEFSSFESRSVVKHHFSTTKPIMWEMLTSLNLYNIWFFGIQRSLPLLEMERYVHKYSFSKMKIEPGAFFKIRPMTIAPWFKCRIMTVEKEKKFGFTFKTNPFNEEYVQFKIDDASRGIWLTCTRTSKGIFSLLSQFNWDNKSKILQELDRVVPRTFENTSFTQEVEQETSDRGGFDNLSKEEIVAYLVNKGMDGDMDVVNAHEDKVARGKAKAMIVKIKRGAAEKPKMPEIKERSDSQKSSGGIEALSKEDMVAYLVNKGMDGDMDVVNAHEDKVARGKAKAMIVKIKRGAAEKPKMPEISGSPQNDNNLKTETKEEIMTRLIPLGLDGNMDEINALEDRVLRGKIKAAIVRAKRDKK